MDENIVLTKTIEIENTQEAEEENLDLKDDKKLSNNSGYESEGSFDEEGDGEYKDRTDESDGENDSDVGISLERQEGDGQESVPQKKVDDDEDKKNPQYIPKRGTFYEHDDRTAEDAEEAEAENKEKLEKDGKKKLWHEKKERWSHDRFNDQDQAPKSKSELVQIYGYDIRNEDGPPRARRRRRYGRGPNKYTRNWEDEDAYGKPGPRPIKKSQNPPQSNSEEFPPLDNKQSNKPVELPKNERNKENTNKFNRQNSRNSEEREEQGSSSQSLNQASQSTENNTNNKQHLETKITENKNIKIGSGRVSKTDNDNIKVSDYKGFTTKSRMGRSFKNQNTNYRSGKKDDFIQSQNFSSRRSNGNVGQQQQQRDLENSMSKISIQDGKPQEKINQNRSGNNQRQGSVPPRLQGESKGSKRYSSIRQRSLPETNNPPIIQQHSNYYGNEISQQPQQSQSSIIHQNPNIIPNSATIPQLAAPPSLSISQQVPVTATPILQAAPQFGPTYPQPPPFIQAGVPPPTFIPQQAPPTLINYVQTQPQYPAGYQSYQAAPFNAVSPSTELYQPQGGITYYSTDQQIPQRTVPPKRPKAAIPIVAPPGELKHLKEEGQIEQTFDINSLE